MTRPSQASDEGAEGASKRGAACATAQRWRVGRTLGLAGSLAWWGRSPGEWRDGGREVRRPVWERSRKEGVPMGALQSLRSTALAESQRLSGAAGLVPTTAGSRQSSQRTQSRAGCLERRGQGPFHARSNRNPSEGPCHAWPLLKDTGPRCLALGFVAATGQVGSPWSGVVSCGVCRVRPV